MANPSKVAEKVVLRLPDGMRTKLAQLAKQNLRSTNSQIVFMLSDAIKDADSEAGASLQKERAA